MVNDQGLTEWSEGYSVGIAGIDDQHKELVGCISELEQALGDGKRGARGRWSAIHHAIVRLSDYTSIHFAVEESLMEIMGYPQAGEHEERHKEFVRKLLEIERESLSNEGTNEGTLVGFLREWLQTHILDDDKRYADYFAQRMGLAEKCSQGTGRKAVKAGS